MLLQIHLPCPELIKPDRKFSFINSLLGTSAVNKLKDSIT